MSDPRELEGLESLEPWDEIWLAEQEARLAAEIAAQAATEKAGSTPARSQRSGETGERFDSAVVDSGEPKARPASVVSPLAESGGQSVNDALRMGEAKECAGYWHDMGPVEIWTCPRCDANDPGECELEKEPEECDNPSARLVSGKAARPSSPSRPAPLKTSCLPGHPSGNDAGHEQPLNGAAK